MIADQIIAASIALTTPILLAAMGGLINRQGGIVNIALDAKMLAGAFVAVVVSAATGSWFVAVVAAGLAGLLVGYAFSLVVTRAGANMIVAGLGLNVFVAGVLGFVLSWFYNSSGTLRLPDVALLPKLLPDAVSDVPLVGLALSELEPLTVFAWLSVLALPFLLANTRWGLRLRASGNAPQVARAMGIPQKAVQDASTAIAGFFSGLGGAHLALASIGLFNEGLTAGRGFIALAAFYFGRDRPVATALVCLFFGFLDATQIRMQTAGLPPKLIGTIPYLMVLIALCFAGWRRLQAKEAMS
ncbi:ABC transporter permease [Oricola sp.]|uniref:ABC transporter permease n=1 Tax=Oricola sp. TaxID=1979950 RepID=UPI003BA8F017